MSVLSLLERERPAVNPEIARTYVEEARKSAETAVLSDAERLLLIAVLAGSVNHKLHQFHRAVGKGKHEVPPFVISPPSIPEEEVNRRAVVIAHPDQGGPRPEVVNIPHNPDIIALTKVTRTFGMDKEKHVYLGDRAYIEEANSYLQRIWDIGNDSKDPALRPHSIVNPYGIHLPVIGNDIMVFHLKDGERVPLFQEKDLHTRQQFLEHYRRLFGVMDREIAPTTTIQAQDGTAVYGIFSDLGLVYRRSELAVFDAVSPELLEGYVYGVEYLPEDHPLRSEIMCVWNLYTPQEQRQLFKGWTPMDGIDPEQNRVVNGGLPNQVPILMLANRQLRSFLLSGDKEGARVAFEQFNNIVTSNTKEQVPLMIRALIQLSANPVEMNKHLQSSTSRRYRAISGALTSVFGERVMAQRVIDVTSFLSNFRQNEHYLQTVVLPKLCRIRE